MPNLTGDRLRKWADELDAEERAELEAEERRRIDELTSQPHLDAEEIEWLRGLRKHLEAEEAAEKNEKPAAGSAEPETGGADDDESDKEAKPRQRTRPGRKNGMAYNFEVDDDGNVIPIDGGRIYSGDDEPDRVPLPDVA